MKSSCKVTHRDSPCIYCTTSRCSVESWTFFFPGTPAWEKRTQDCIRLNGDCVIRLQVKHDCRWKHDRHLPAENSCSPKQTRLGCGIYIICPQLRMRTFLLKCHTYLAADVGLSSRSAGWTGRALRSPFSASAYPDRWWPWKCCCRWMLWNAWDDPVPV